MAIKKTVKKNVKPLDKVKLPHGRPLKWTDEKIQEEAEHLLKWADLPGSIVLGQCFGDRGYSYQDSMDWEERHYGFRESLKLARTKIGCRREAGAAAKVYDNSIISKTMGMYDPYYKKYLKEMKDDKQQEQSAKLDDIRGLLSELTQRDSKDIPADS